MLDTNDLSLTLSPSDPVRVGYLGSGSIERLVLSVVEVSRDDRHKSRQAYSPAAYLYQP
ncbi:MAG: hypothetical protein RM022_020915 [Nostoc sp. EfeVER01]|nr:hypothetical protein [Nostoc sp. EfeVER01]MDZ7944339.1 hypothetical protein [Nostoc sp. EfeVER01]